MTIEEAVLWGQYAITSVLYIGGPPLIAALIVGLIISVLQAVTQVNEMTLVFVPKIAAVFGVILIMGGWMLEQAMNFGEMAFASIGAIGQ